MDSLLQVMMTSRRDSLDRTIATTTNNSTTTNNNDDYHQVNSILDLPPEMMHHIYSFMDIPMLGTMAQVHNNNNNNTDTTNNTDTNTNHTTTTGILRQFAGADLLWRQWVQERFQISPRHHARPKLYGGKDWKDAYRTMHLCRRMPKSRWTSRKAVFAKGYGSSSAPATPTPAATASAATTTKTTRLTDLSIWVVLNHTENCRTRVLNTAAGNNNDNNAMTASSSRHYVDFWVCLQHTKSNGPPIRVHVLQSELQYLGSSDLGHVYSEACVQEQINVAVQENQEDVLLPCGRYENNPPPSPQWVFPRLLHKRTPASSSNSSRRFVITHEGDDDITRGITLQPMDFCIVSIPFECGPDDIFETDVLARTVSLQVPFSTIASTTTASAMNSGGSSGGGGNIHHNHDDEDDDRCFLDKPQDDMPTAAAVATAWFVPESDVWDQYCELPGGCLTLSNRDRRMHL